MKRNLLFNFVATLLFFLLTWFHKSSGFVEAVAIGAPTTFFLIVAPLFLIFYIFSLVSLSTWKTKTSSELIVKVMMIFHIHILTICNMMSSQVYIALSSNLQTTLDIYVYAMCFIFVAFYAHHLYIHSKNLKQKTK